jgi:putative hemolysin
MTELHLKFLEFDGRWLLTAACVLFLAFYVSLCRKVLDSFSRKLLFESRPVDEHAALESHVEREDLYEASLRTLDHFGRLALLLCLATGRFARLPREGLEEHLSAALNVLALSVELAFVYVIFLEILPGIVARLSPEPWFVRLAGGMGVLHRMVMPFRAVVSGFVGGIVKGLGGKAARTSADILEEEILSAAEEGEREGLLEPRDIDMIESIITFGGVEVSEVMTPRTEMVCLDVAESFASNLERAVNCGHSRIPVYRESKDAIIGILYVKDLLKYWDQKESITLEDVLRETHFVPLSKKIDELLQEFKTQRFHIAIVLDEFGGTSGLITIEDVIEEIVGEITDEFEKAEEPALSEVEPGLVEVDAALRVDELNDELKLGVPEGEGYETLGGFLFSQLGRIPTTGETFEFHSASFEVTEAEERRIRRVRIRMPNAESPSGANGAQVGDP